MEKSSANQSGPVAFCSRCHAANAPGARFCNGCGAPRPSYVGPANQAEIGVTADAPIDPLIGRIIEDKYRIDSVIGAGGMGTVYQSTRLLIGDQVAIKILHSERVADPHASERFRREARAAARLKHPNAVSIYDFGVSSDGLQYLVMELIEGKSLREVSRQEGLLDGQLAAEVTSQVCAALDEAHRQEIVHRDIKPDNIILSRTAAGLRIKVLDFGIAKLRDDTASHLTQTGSVMGTPHYMSPEQCLGEELDERADIYSMGVVLYEMLCGRVPFNSPISTAVVVQHVNQPPPPLRSLNPSVSPHLEAAVLRALEKRREARPQSAGAFAREVSAAAAETTGDNRYRWTGVAQSSPLVHADDEKTIERAFLSGRVSREIAEMSPTVHLAGLSGPTGSVSAPRATGGGDTVRPASINKAGARKYSVLALSIALLVVLTIGLWLASGRKATIANAPTPADNADLSAVNDNKNHAEAKPPPGMTLVRGGTFIMGSNEGDQDSRPPHSVALQQFFIDTHEVTCDEYKKFIDSTGHAAPKTWTNGNYPVGTARQPVTDVSWEDATAYAQWTGKRLPTEEEWELAARGPKDLLYPWGNVWKAGCANAGKEGRVIKGMADVGTHDCGSVSGTMDMIGNAWEWTASDWAPFPNGRLRDVPKPGEKVIRGGSWESPQTVTASFRAGLAGPAPQTGFRCAKDSQP